MRYLINLIETLSRQTDPKEVVEFDIFYQTDEDKAYAIDLLNKYKSPFKDRPESKIVKARLISYAQRETQEQIFRTIKMARRGLSTSEGVRPLSSEPARPLSS